MTPSKGNGVRKHGSFNRRQLLSIAGGSACAAILAGCGGKLALDLPPPPSLTETPTASVRPATATAAPTATATATPNTSMSAYGDARTAPNYRPSPSVPLTTTPVADATAIGNRPTTGLPMPIYRQTPGDAIAPTFFGMHIHNATTSTPWPVIPFGTWRLWDASVAWPDLEPERDAWDFQRLDACVALAEKHGVEILLPLGLTPNWASARPDEPGAHGPGTAAEPRNLDDWRAYVRAVATRYRGRIRYYELWNEVNVREFYTGTVEQMILLARETHQVLKGVDATLKLVSPSSTERASGLAWLDIFLAAEGGAYVDIIAHHLYVSPDPPEAILPFADQVRAIMKRHGVRDKPLWNTESGWYRGTKVFATDAEESAYLARSYLLNWAVGAERFSWYAWDNHGWSSIDLTADDNDALRPAGDAYREVRTWLVGSRMTSCSAYVDNTWICQLTRPDGSPARIVWNPERTIGFNTPVAWRARAWRDLTGAQREMDANNRITIGPSPLLLESAT